MFGGARTVGGLILRNQLRREAVRGIATVSGGVAGFAAARAMKRSRSRYSSDMGGRRLFKRRRVMKRGMKKVLQRSRRVRFSRGNTMSQPQVSEEIRQRISTARVSRAVVNRRAVSAAVTPYNLIFKGLNKEFNRAGPGFYNCGRTKDASGICSWPVYAFNLTSIQQGNITTQPFYRLLSNNTGQFYWVNQDGADNSNVASPNLQVKQSVNISSAGLYVPKGILDWVRLRFIFYCPTTRPIKYRVRIVKMMDDDIAPDEHTAPLANFELNNWGMSYVKPLTANPISSLGRFSERVKVVAQRTFTLEPGQTDDKDTNPSRRVVDWFSRLGRLVNFYQTRDNPSVTGDQVVNGAVVYPVTGSGNVMAKPASVRERLYVLIDAGAYEQFGSGIGNEATFSSAVHGSFDMNIELGYKVTDQA